MTATPDLTAAEELRGAGLRVTAVRVALLEAVRHGDHLGVEALAASVRERVGHVSLQAVYEALNALASTGLVRRIEPAGSPARFEGRIGDNHHHVVCRSCGAVADVDCAVGEAPCLTPTNDHGFEIDEAEVIYWGLCPDCSSRNVPFPTSPEGILWLRTTTRSSPMGRPLRSRRRPRARARKAARSRTAASTPRWATPTVSGGPTA
jgi:Fur family ferric uptake transcriptional regulator